MESANTSVGLPAYTLGVQLLLIQFRETLQKLLPSALLEKLLAAKVITQSEDGKLASTIRVSDFYLPHLTQQPREPRQYYIHSALSSDSDCVFFGPDTYLFLDFLESTKDHVKRDPRSAIDICCGAGAGAIHMAQAYHEATVLGLDSNPKALDLAKVNASLAKTENVEFISSDLYAAVPTSLQGNVDLIVSNPRYITSSTEQGGGLPLHADGRPMDGLDIALQIIAEGLELLFAGGLILLYTGVSIPARSPGSDPMLEKVQQISGSTLLEYRIIHPDMWPEEIGKGAYADVARIMTVGIVLRKGD